MQELLFNRQSIQPAGDSTSRQFNQQSIQPAGDSTSRQFNQQSASINLLHGKLLVEDYEIRISARVI